MFRFLRHELSSSKIDSIKGNVLEAAKGDDVDALWADMKPLLRIQNSQENVCYLVSIDFRLWAFNFA